MIEVIGQGDNGVVLQKVVHNNGAVLRYQFGIPGDASSMKIGTLEEGKCAIIRTTYKVVDRNGEATVRKATKGKRCWYEYNNGNGFVEVPTLVEARKAIGKVK